MPPGRKALIIDDSVMLLRYAAGVLGTRMPGLEVLTARRGSEGFYQADRFRPDLLLVNHALPDTPGEALCRRLEKHPGTATLPILLLCGQGMDPQKVRAGHPNVVGTLIKPFTPEELFHSVRAALATGTPPAGPGLTGDPAPAATTRSRARLQLPTPPTPATAGAAGTERRSDGDPNRIVFRGTTTSFSLKASLLAAVGTHAPGVLRLSAPVATATAGPDDSQPAPTEVYLRDGQVALVTTRNSDLYAAVSPLPTLPADLNDALRQGQRATGCPPFLALLAAGRMPGPEAWRATEDAGQRLFARLWTGARWDFEFERLTELPDFARGPAGPPVIPPPSAPDLEALDEATREVVRLDDWLLGTLRRLRPEDVPEPGDGHERFDGVPAYTREGYTAIRRLQLTDLEAAFARQVDGRTDLRTLAGRLGLGAPAAFLLLFRFRSVELMDLWPAGALVARAHVAAAPPGDASG